MREKPLLKIQIFGPEGLQLWRREGVEVGGTVLCPKKNGQFHEMKWK